MNLISLFVLDSIASLKFIQTDIFSRFQKGTTKHLSLLLTKIIKTLQVYCATIYSKSSVNQMLILKNSTELLET